MKKFVRTLIIILTTTPFLSFAYDAPTTHAGLSQEIVSFYNYSHVDKITDAQKEKIITGSIEEDTPDARVLNHFYDPVRNIGFKGNPSSKEWVSGSQAQNVFTWPKGVEAYARGDIDTAYLILGHVLHLLEDAGVPDHTRNDAHPPFLSWEQSPYEYWTSLHKTRETLAGLGYSYFAEGEKEKSFPTLDGYFDFLATYSNENFFSKDTIDPVIKTYSKPEVSEVDSQYAWNIDSISKGRVRAYLVKRTSSNNLLKILTDSKDFSVLSEYFDRLSRQIIPTGAGVISLFIKEGEEARKTYEKKRDDEEMLAEKEKVEKEEAEKRLASAGFFSKPKYWMQYTWEYDVKQGVWTSVARMRESASDGLAMVYQGIKNIGTILSFSVSEGVKEASITSNTISFTQKRNSNAVGPIFALLTEYRPASETISSVQATAPPEPPHQNNAQTMPLLHSPMTIIPGFGGGGGGVVSVGAPVATIPDTSSVADETSTSSDNTSPDITAVLSDCTYSLWSNECALPVSTTTLSWTTHATDTSKFAVYVDDVFLGEGSSTEAVLTLVPGIHTVAVVAKDDSGNSATSSALSLTYVKEPVVISEIAWPGTEVSPNNQWIELYNNTDKPINLSSMKLVSETSAFAVPLSSTIAPHSYYLLERSTDDVVPGVVADMVYGSDTGLSPLGEVLALIYTMGEREVAIDSTPDVSTCEGWCEGSDASFSTMVRLNT